MLKLRHYFGSVSFYKYALTIAVPVMVQMFIQSFVSLIDNFMVAELGNIKMSGVNVANQFVFVFMTALNTMSIAGGIFMSQYNGAKDSEGMRQSYRFKQIVMFLLAAVTIAASLIAPDFLLGALLQTNADRVSIAAEGKIYLRIVVLTFIPMSISTAFASSLRETGCVKPPMYISIAGAVVNTILNYILIYGNLGAPRLETAGAAYATVVSRVLEVLLFFIYIKKIKPDFYVGIFDILKIKADVFKTILKKSGWIFAADMSWAVGETIATAVYNSRGGAEVVAGMAAGWTIADLFFLVFPAVNTSVGVIAGTTLGRNELDKAREQARWLQAGSFILGGFVGILEAFSVLIIPIVFGRLSAEAQYVTKKLILIIALYMPIWTYQNSQYATARAGGDAVMGIWVDSTVNLFLFAPGMILLAVFTNMDSPTMYGVVKITSIMKAVFAGIMLKKEKWIKNLTK